MLAWQSKTFLSGRVASKNEGSVRDELGSAALIMDWQSPHNKWWIRLVAITLTIAFIHQDIVWAQEGTPVWSKGQGGSFNVKTPINDNNKLNANIAVPKDIAVTKEVF